MESAADLPMEPANDMSLDSQKDTTVQTTKPSIVKRLYVGNLNTIIENETLEILFEDIVKRFSRYGKVLKDKEDLSKSSVYVTKNFGYVTMKFEDISKYTQLLKSYNNVNYKGNKLIVQEAKSSYKEKLNEEIKQNLLFDNNKYKKLAMKKDYEHYKKMKNIKLTFKDRLQVLPGRHRVTKRNYTKSNKDEVTGKLVKYSNKRRQTFRIYLNGALKTFVLSNKKKLWGVQKGRTIRDLTFEFDTNTLSWRNGLGHTIEHLNYNKLGRNERLELDSRKDTEDLGSMDIEEEEIDNDKLADIFSRIDFDKQVEVGEDGLGDKSEYGIDYELKHGFYDSDEEEDEEPKKEKVKESSEESDGQTESSSESESDSSSDEEFMPKFGVPKTSNTETISNTETLRGLFQSKNTSEQENKTSSLKLIVDDDDIDHEKDNEIKHMAEKAKEYISKETTTQLQSFDNNTVVKRDVGLFFPHFNSFFLQPQTSLNKIKTVQIETFEDWDEKFWENRGKWTSEFKNRKRGELKKIRKRQTNSTVLL